MSKTSRQTRAIWKRGAKELLGEADQGKEEKRNQKPGCSPKTFGENSKSSPPLGKKMGGGGGLSATCQRGVDKSKKPGGNSGSAKKQGQEKLRVMKKL